MYLAGYVMKHTYTNPYDKSINSYSLIFVEITASGFFIRFWSHFCDKFMYSAHVFEKVELHLYKICSFTEKMTTHIYTT